MDMIQSCCVMGGMSPTSGDRKRKCSESRDWSRLDDQFFRINVSLINIISNLEALPRILEDLEDDPLKASKKQIEFSTRFTRNYLCELRQKMNDIRKFLEQSEGDNPPKNLPIFQCFTSSFQTVHQAFQNIEKNLRYVIFNKMPLQISEFLNCFGDLCMISNAAYWEGCGEKLLELENLNSTLISKLNGIENNTRKAEMQKKEKQRTILKFKNEVKKPQPAPKKSKGINLSMYKVSQVTNFEKLWKKKTRALAEARFGNKQEFKVKNKEESLNSEKSKEKLNVNSDKGKIKETESKTEIKEEIAVRSKRKIIKPVPENEMETMVQNINSVTSDSEVDDETKKQEPTENIVNLTTEITVKNEIQQAVVEAEKFHMGPVLDEAFKTMFNHIMSQVMTNIDPDREDCTLDEAARTSLAQEVKRSNFREDNVKLICIVEDETGNHAEMSN